MPSASPGTSVKKPDPNIKSMYPVSGAWLSPRLELCGTLWLGAEGGDSWAVFLPNRGCFPHPLSQGEGHVVGRSQGPVLCWNRWPLHLTCVRPWLGSADSFGEEYSIRSDIKMCVLSP